MRLYCSTQQHNTLDVACYVVYSTKPEPQNPISAHFSHMSAYALLLERSAKIDDSIDFTVFDWVFEAQVADYWYFLIVPATISTTPMSNIDGKIFSGDRSVT